MGDSQSKGKLLALALTLPFVIGIPPLVGFWLGSYLDDAFDTRPLFLYGFLVLGVLAAIREVYRIVKRIKDDIEDA